MPTCAKTEQDPADTPKSVTDPGSPPKCSIFLGSTKKLLLDPKMPSSHERVHHQY